MYFKWYGHEWKNKKGFIHFLLLDFKWEQKQKDVEKSSFFKALYKLPKISQIVVQKSFWKDFFLDFENK